MSSVSPEARSFVSVSPAGAVSINSTANTSGLAGTAGNTRGAMDAAKILKEITEALQDLFKLSSQPAAVSKGPALFSPSASSTSDTLGPIHNSLQGASQKLSMAVGGSPASPKQSATASPTSQTNSDWPYPDMGPSPFISNPTGSGPTGSFHFNPMYFPSRASAEKIAQMIGGKVVEQDAMLTAPGSHFTQDQPNYMVEVPNGNVFNPGFIAQAISVKQPRTTIDAMIYSEVNNTAVAIGQAPPFVPVKSVSSAGSSAAVSTPAPRSSTATPSSAWSSVDQLSSHLYSSPGSSIADESAGSMRDRIQNIVKMLQILSQMSSIRLGIQPDALGNRTAAK